LQFEFIPIKKACSPTHRVSDLQALLLALFLILDNISKQLRKVDWLFIPYCYDSCLFCEGKTVDLVNVIGFEISKAFFSVADKESIKLFSLFRKVDWIPFKHGNRVKQLTRNKRVFCSSRHGI
jgi:hypothetical protein